MLKKLNNGEKLALVKDIKTGIFTDAQLKLKNDGTNGNLFRLKHKVKNDKNFNFSKNGNISRKITQILK